MSEIAIIVVDEDGRFVDFRPSRSLPLSIQSSSPVLGAVPSYTIPVRQLLEIQSIEVDLVTDVAVANRYLMLTITDPNKNELFRCIDNLVQTASTTVTHVWAAGVGTVTSGTGAIVNTLPHFPLIPELWIISFTGIGLDVGDQLSAIRIWGINHSWALVHGVKPAP